MKSTKQSPAGPFAPIKVLLPLLAGCGVLLFSACNKTDDFEDLDLLVDKNWQLTSITQGGTELAADCDLDDVLRFEDATNFDYRNGGSICDDSEASKTADTWKIVDDFTVLRMKYTFSGRGNVVEYWKIVELSESTLIIQDDLAEGNDQVPEIRAYVN